MSLINRFAYLLYYFKKTDLSKLWKYLSFASRISGKSRIKLMADAVYSVFRYNTSILDYFTFGFYILNKTERNEWVGTGFMYEYQLRMNPKGSREVLENKIMFLQHFRPYIKREFHSLKEIRSNEQLAENLIHNPSGRIVLKGSRGQIGAEVKVVDCNTLNTKALIDFMTENEFDLVEEYVVQHNALMSLSASGLNTVRIITQLHKGNVDFLGARLRISVNSQVDNLAAGNLAAPVDIVTGIVTGPAVYSDITKKEQTVHPVTGITIPGFAIPHWKEIIELARVSALDTFENKSVGWDIAVTEEGPELIEGNHNWCKALWQLPVKKGLKKELEKYL